MIQPESRESRTNVGLAAKIFSEHGDFIRQVICSQVNDKTQADDIFQDFFLSLVHRPVPQDVENIEGYLCTAITNDIIDTTRRRENNNNMYKHCANHNHSVNKRTSEKILIEVEEVRQIFKLIEVRLTDRQYQAIVLRYRTNLSINEIADKMGVKDTSVRKYIFRGLSKVRQFIKQKQDNDDNSSKP